MRKNQEDSFKDILKNSWKRSAFAFLHSSLLTSAMWNNQIDYFSGKCQTITFDLCGHLPNNGKERGSK
jgi:hypothetical protein